MLRSALEHPLLLLSVGWLLCWLVTRRLVADRQRQRRTLAAACALAFGAYALCGVLYAASPRIYDHCNATVIPIAWRVLQGGSAYPLPDAAERYANPYGPMQYGLLALAFAAFGAGIQVAKATSALAGLLSVVFTYLGLRRLAGRRDLALLGAAFAAACLLSFDARFAWVSFWVRGDSFLLCFASLALLASLIGSTRVGGLLLALSLGLAVSLKLHGALYLLPAVVVFTRRSSGRALGAVLVTAAGVAALPFALRARFPLEAYLGWLQQTGGLPFRPGLLLDYVEWTVWLFAIPLWLALHLHSVDRVAYREWLRAERVFLLLLGGGACLAAVPGANDGSGPHHLMPFVPAVALLGVGLIGRTPACAWKLRGAAWAVPFAAGLLLCAGLGAVRMLRSFAGDRLPPAAAVVADLEALVAAHPEATVHVGCGEQPSYPLTYYRCIPIFEGHPYLIDPCGVMCHLGSGIALPQATRQRVFQAGPQVWLIPRGESPFMLRSLYAEKPLTFDDAFRREFARLYRIEASTEFFDVWTRRD